MKATYYRETDSLYIDISTEPSHDSAEVAEGIVIDYDKDGRIVGIDIDQASRKLDLRQLTGDLVEV